MSLTCGVHPMLSVAVSLGLEWVDADGPASSHFLPLQHEGERSPSTCPGGSG